MKYSTEQKEKIMAEYKNSKISVVKFCETQEVGVATLKRWLRAEKTKFVKVGQVKNNTEKTTEKIRIECGNFKIYVSPATDEILLGNVLKKVVELC